MKTYEITVLLNTVIFFIILKILSQISLQHWCWNIFYFLFKLFKPVAVCYTCCFCNDLKIETKDATSATDKVIATQGTMLQRTKAGMKKILKQPTW